MKVRMELDLPVHISRMVSESNGNYTIQATITIDKHAARVLGETGLSTIESTLKLAIEDAMPGYFEGGD